MIRPLRTAHRLAWTALALLLPALLALALLRRHAPEPGPLPPELARPVAR